MARRPKRSFPRSIWAALFLFIDAVARELFRRPGADRSSSDWKQVPDRRPRVVSAWKQVPDRRPQVVSEWKPPASAAPRRRRLCGLPVRRTLAIATLLLFGGAVTLALFTKTTANSGNTYAAAADFRAPTVDRAKIQQVFANEAGAGHVAQGRVYVVFANVADTGNPASGIASVTADLCNITSGAGCGSSAMSPTSYTINGNTYNYASGALAADNPLSEGPKSYSIAAADNDSNSATTGGFNAIVDNTTPSVTRQVACGGNGCTATGYVGVGNTYYVYAQATDSASGVDTVTTDPRNITASASATTALSSSGGPWTIGGNSYNYRSAQLTADSGLADGSTKSYTVTAKDNVWNQASPSANATVDNTAPTVGTMALDKNFGRFANYIRSSAPYSLYADASDADSGIDTGNAKANVAIDAPNTLTTGQTNVSMCYSGSGYDLPDYHATTSTNFDFKSDADSNCDANFTALTTDASIPNGTRNWNVTVADNAGNTAIASKTANLKSTQNTAVDVKLRNTGGGINGRLELGDDILYNSSGSTDPESVLSGWDGAADSTGNVVARLINGGGTCVTNSDRLQVWNATNTVQTNLGTICLGSAGYTTSTITFGLTGTPSTLEAGFTNPYQLTLGTPSATAATVAANTTAVWTPGSGIYDLAGNDTLTTPATNTIDNTPPTLTRAEIQRTANNNPGYFKQGDSFYVYAELADSIGTIDSASVTANVAVAGNVISTGNTSVKLCSNGGPFTVGGQSYAYRSDGDGTCGGAAPATTSDASITDGSKTFNITFGDNSYNSTTASASATEDSTAPSVSSSRISKTPGYYGDKVKQGGSYFVYGDISDAGVGISSVNSNVCNVSNATCNPVALASGSYSTQGTSYNYRNASALTVKNPLAEGSYTYTVTPTDALGNTASPSFNVTVDNTAPAGNDNQCNNKAGGTPGLAETGDTCLFSWNDAMDPFGFQNLWTGGSQAVTVRILNAGTGSNPAACVSGTNDTLVVYDSANTTQVNVGCINLGNAGYVTANRTFTSSSMLFQGFANQVLVTLGTCAGCGAAVNSNATSTLYPLSAAYDFAGNASSTTSATETGAADFNF